MPATPSAPVRVETDRVRGSRFLAVLAPATGEAVARSVVERRRREDPDASHHCWAYRGADGTERSDDDGEPRDTAGAPILRHLGGADAVDVVCVVTRWFGGTKLGRGGLVRAYGDAAALALDAADLVVHVPTARMVVAHRYDDTAAVDAVLHAHDAVVVDEAYAADVTRTVEVRAAVVGAVRAALVDATAGRVVPVVADEPSTDVGGTT